MIAVDDLLAYVVVGVIAAVCARSAYRHHDRLWPPFGGTRGEARVELLVVAHVLLVGTLLLVMTNHADSSSFDRISWALLAAVTGTTGGTLTARRDQNRRTPPPPPET